MNASNDSSALAQLKQTISQELANRRNSGAIEAVPEVAVATPAIGLEGRRLVEEQKPEQTKASQDHSDSQGQQETAPALSTGNPPETPEPTNPSEKASKDGAMSNAGLEMTPNDEGTRGKTGTATDEEVKAVTEDAGAEHSTPAASTPVKAEETPKSDGRSEPQEAVTPIPARTVGATAGSKHGTPSETPGKANTSTNRTNGPTRPSPRRAQSAPKRDSPKDAPGKQSGLMRARSHIKRSDQQATPAAGTATAQSKGKAGSSAYATQGPTSAIASTGPTSAGTKGLAHGKDHAHPTSDVSKRSSVFAPTAASAAKAAVPGVSISRTPSNASARAGTVRRQPSTRNGTKPTMAKGKPSSDVPHEPVNRSTSSVKNEQESHISSHAAAPKPVKEGFLARMMRPTASSANKTHEKPSTAPGPAATRARSLPHRGGPPEHDKEGKGYGTKKPSADDLTKPEHGTKDEHPAPEGSGMTEAAEVPDEAPSHNGDDELVEQEKRAEVV